jgi:TPR repeat protein
VNSADAEHHPGPSEPREDKDKAASAAKPSAGIPAKEKDFDNQAVATEVIKKPVSKNDSAKGKLPEEPRHPSMALVNAQRYLQGRGVRQNCEQGLLYLKAATKQNDPQAAVQMAALYASGHCVPQDRVQAYKWFTSARDLQPANHWIEKNLNWLWADMTSAERQQISK